MTVFARLSLKLLWAILDALTLQNSFEQSIYLENFCLSSAVGVFVVVFVLWGLFLCFCFEIGSHVPQVGLKSTT